MLDETKRYRIAIKCLKDQRRILHTRQGKLEKEFFAEVKRIEKGLAKNREMEEDLVEELKSVRRLPF